jgi:hypothetical protein
VATATHLITEEEAASPTPKPSSSAFAGDSGDGMQLTGGQFTLSTALAGNDLATFPISRPRSARRRARPSASAHSRSISARPRSRPRATSPDV